MADQRFKPGDRVVRTGPSMFDVERGSTYEVLAVEVEVGLGVHLRGVAGPFYGYDATLFRLADDQPAPTDDQHPWASELRKRKLDRAESVAGDEMHPFCTDSFNVLSAVAESPGPVPRAGSIVRRSRAIILAWEAKPC